MSGHLGERLSALLDGELSEGDRAEAQVHLRECPACAQQLEELAAVDAMARDAAVEAPAGYFDELPGRVRTRIRARRKSRLAPAAVWAAAAAAVVMVAVVAPRVLREAPSPASAVAPATVPGMPARADAAASPAVPAIPAATVPPPADALSKTNAPVESDKAAARAKGVSKERLARAVPVTAAPTAQAEEAEMRVTREDARSRAADRRVAEAAPAPAAPAAVQAPGYAAAARRATSTS